MSNMKLGDKLADLYLKCPKWVQFVISWVIIVGVIVGFLWLNDHYLHLPINGNEECSGTFEFSCGDPEDMRGNHN